MMMGIVNCRDLGGLKTVDGKGVRSGRLIRSGELYNASAEDVKALGKVLAVFDLRSDRERAYHPDPEIPGAENIHISVTQRVRRHLSDSQRSLEDKVKDILKGYDRGEPGASMRMPEVYRNIVDSPQTWACIERIVRILADEPEGCVIWHCTAGKDRTGVIAAILLRLLNVPDDAIMQDYLLSNDALRYEIDAAYALALKLSESERAAEYIKGFFAACPCWLGAALDRLDESPKSMDAFLQERTSVSQAEIVQFRAGCVERGAIA